MFNAVVQLITACIGALGFSLLFNVRKERLPAASFGGLLVWGVYILADWFCTGGVFLPSVCAAACASVYAEAMARIEKAPATVTTPSPPICISKIMINWPKSDQYVAVS